MNENTLPEGFVVVEEIHGIDSQRIALTVELGDSVGWNWIRRQGEMSYDDDQIIVPIPVTHVSMFDDDMLYRSNSERLTEDFGDYLIQTDYADGSGLALLVGSIVPEMLVDAVLGLVDYPAYDEQDYSQREWEQLSDFLNDEIRWMASRHPVADTLEDSALDQLVTDTMVRYGDLGQASRPDDVRQDDLDECFEQALAHLSVSV